MGSATRSPRGCWRNRCSSSPQPHWPGLGMSTCRRRAWTERSPCSGHFKSATSTTSAQGWKPSRICVRTTVPTLRPVPGIDLGAYRNQLIERFASEAVKDTLERQVVDASDRLPKFLLPVLRHQLEAGGPIACCALVLAAWSLYLETGLGEQGGAIVDRRRGELLEAVAAETVSHGGAAALRARVRRPRHRQASS